MKSMSKRFLRLSIALGTCALIASTSALAADGATFESFYRPAWSLSWVMAGTAALLFGLMIATGVVAVPATMMAVINGIGGSIGSMFGLSGAAATNFGLALLGGGSLINNGLGMAGGTIMLATALSFSTDVVFDYAVNTVQAPFSERSFAEASWKMMTLPLPRNTSGPESVVAAGKELDTSMADSAWQCAKAGRPTSIDHFQSCIAGKEQPQRQRVRAALATLRAFSNTPETTIETAERKGAMYALLLFLNNEYQSAEKAADVAYELGLKASHTPTLPAFISGTSTLYNEKPNFGRSFALFQYAITAEPKNPLTPVLFSTYLDRLSYRLNDGSATLNEFDRVTNFAVTLGDDDRKIAIQQILLANYFMQLKVAQQQIISLTGTQNKTVRENPTTIARVKQSNSEYSRILATTKNLIDRQVALLGTVSREESIWTTVKSGKNPFSGNATLDRGQGWSEALWTFSKAWAEYRRDESVMAQRVANFEAEALNRRKPTDTTEAPDEKSKSVFDWVKGLFQ